MHRAGEMEVAPHQLHAGGVHELERRQDLAQHAPAGVESLQNLSEARTACNRTQHLSCPPGPAQGPEGGVEAVSQDTRARQPTRVSRGQRLR